MFLFQIWNLRRKLSTSTSAGEWSRASRGFRKSFLSNPQPWKLSKHRGKDSVNFFISNGHLLAMFEMQWKNWKRTFSIASDCNVGNSWEYGYVLLCDVCDGWKWTSFTRVQCNVKAKVQGFPTCGMGPLGGSSRYRSGDLLGTVVSVDEHNWC
jgi:hypothetical protein